jgi:hypothetical protein
MGMLVEPKSGPMLEGVLITEWTLLCVRHEHNERGSISAGESIEVVDMVSKSGVPGSRYGFVVLMKVTRRCLRNFLKSDIAWNPPCLGMSIQMAFSSKVFLYA